MAFVDGGYLRGLCRVLRCDCTNFSSLYDLLRRKFNSIPKNQFRGDIIRIYYYDAIVDDEHPEHGRQRKYFDSIADNSQFCTIRLGKLVDSSNKGFKQKGVDILMSVDAITKAYLDQYDVGIFLMGDADFKPLIEAVKDVGKKTLCLYYPTNSSRELTRIFDMRETLDLNEIRLFMA